MPVDLMCAASSAIAGKAKRTRRTNPGGVGFTQVVDRLQIVYSGTGHAMRTRLLEHMLNEGNRMTTKLSLRIADAPFSDYDWFVSYVFVKDYPTRYALEAWWREKKGWPPCCIR